MTKKPPPEIRCFRFVDTQVWVEDVTGYRRLLCIAAYNHDRELLIGALSDVHCVPALRWNEEVDA